MRKTWIAIATIALAAGLVGGLVGGYRIGRIGTSRRAAARAERAEGAPPAETVASEQPVAPAEPVAHPDERRSHEPAAGDPASRPEPFVPRTLSRDAARADWTDAPAPSEPAPTGSGPAGTAATTVAASVPPAAGLPSHQQVSIPAPTPAPSPQPSEHAKDEAAAATADDPESDRRPPVLLYLRFDPPEIRDGGAATLSIGASDDLSGVKFVFGTVRSPSEAAIMPFTAQDQGGSGVFTSPIAIPRQAETGNWFVGSLQIVDKADNPLNLVFTKGTVPPGGALRVSSDESDSTAPDVHRVSIEKGTVAAGENNQITVEVDDDRSGVASVTGTFQSPSKAAFLPFGCRQIGEHAWTGDVVIPANADCGEWTLRQLRVADKANNTAYLTADSPQVGPVSFVVSGGGGCDADPPVIDGLYVAPGVVSNAAASEVSLTFTVHDEGSGVDSLSGRIEGPVSANGLVPKIYFASKADAKNPDAPLIAKFSVPQHAASGVWRVAFVQVMDKAHNTRNYNIGDPALVNASFIVE
jgi:hypothetical protein